MANAESEGDFIRQYIEQYQHTKTCLKLVEAARRKYYESLSGKSEGEFILEFLKDPKKGNTKQCQEYVKEAMAMWKDLRGNTNTELQIIKNIKALELGHNNASAKELIRGAKEEFGEFFPGDVNQYTTVAKLDAYIGAATKGVPRTDTRAAGTVTDTVTDLCKDPQDEFKRGVCGWSRMESSGSEFDCLIHSFLTMVSPNFRQLPLMNKDAIASAFRRTLFLKFPAINRVFDRDEVKKRVPAAYVFLTDSELQILSLTYGINIIVFEQAKTERVMRMTHKMPATITPLDNFPESDVFYLISNRNKHYEAVKAGASYTVPRETMEQILIEFPQEFSGEARPECKYKGSQRDIQEGDTVYYRDERATVLDRRFDGDPPRCVRITILLVTGAQEAVAPSELTFVGAGGGKRSGTQRSGTQRSGTQRSGTRKRFRTGTRRSGSRSLRRRR